MDDREKARMLLEGIYIDLAHKEYSEGGYDTPMLRSFRLAMKLLGLRMDLPSQHGDRD